MYINVLSAPICVSGMHIRCLWKPKRELDLLELESQKIMGRDPNCSLQAQYLLLTAKPSPAPPTSFVLFVWLGHTEREQGSEWCEIRARQ